MEILRTILQIAILTIYYFIGSWIADVLHLTVPGSIIGLLLLWLSLYFKIVNGKMIEKGASFLLTYLTLFFIPATVAVITYPELLSKIGIYLVGGVIISTIFTLIFTGKVTQWIERKESGGKI